MGRQARPALGRTITVNLDVTTAKTLLIALTNALQGGGEKLGKSPKGSKATPKAAPKRSYKSKR